MKNKFTVGFVAGAVIFGAVGAFAVQYVATDNPYPVQLNGQDVSIEGYQINDYTYFKLRDIADATGGFDVDFQEDIIFLNSANSGISISDYALYAEVAKQISDIAKNAYTSYTENWESYHNAMNGTLMGDINEFLTWSSNRYQKDKQTIEGLKSEVALITTIDCTELTALMDNAIKMLDHYISFTNLQAFDTAFALNDEDSEAMIFYEYADILEKANQLYDDIYNAVRE